MNVAIAASVHCSTDHPDNTAIKSSTSLSGLSDGLTWLKNVRTEMIISTVATLRARLNNIVIPFVAIKNGFFSYFDSRGVLLVIIILVYQCEPSTARLVL